MCANLPKKHLLSQGHGTCTLLFISAYPATVFSRRILGEHRQENPDAAKSKQRQAPLGVLYNPFAHSTAKNRDLDVSLGSDTDSSLSGYREHFL